MSILPTRTSVTTRDRLGFTLLVAVMLHIMIVFGLGFKDEPPATKPPLQSMEVIMLETEAPAEKADKADFLAAISQSGGGEIEHKERPASPPATPLPTEQVKSVEHLTQMIPLPSPPTRAVPNVLAQEKPGNDLARDAIEETPLVRPQPVPDAAQLMMRSRQLASIAANQDDTVKTFSRQPRQRYITASTREYGAAAYMDSWRRTVERIGNVNYPEEARRQGLAGALVLDVALRPDGSVQEIRVARSSGKKVLDDAAVRIVQLAAPFSPFPPEIRKDTDILHIIRTWQFESDNLAAQ